ncbi:MAG TPA: hypothetical protein VEQ65_10725, partial [Opitutus sp.]|nr:hypothetical protein [Opitutus sp.]
MLFSSVGCKPKAPPTWAERTTVNEDLGWYGERLRNAYEHYGKKNPKWDATVRRLLDEVAYCRAAETPPSARMIKLLNKADRQGCNDPLILYFCARYEPWRGDSERQKGDFVRAYLAIRESGYGPLERFYAAWRAGHVLGHRPDQRTASERAYAHA